MQPVMSRNLGNKQDEDICLSPRESKVDEEE